MKNSIIKAASLLVVAAMVAMVFAGVQAAPVQPYTRFGDDAANDTTPVSSLVTAWIDGVEYGSTTSDANGYYVLETRGDETDTTNEKEGGLNADAIQYVIGGRLTTTSAGSFCAQTATYTAGAILEGPLSASATVPRLLKINNISTESTISGGPTDYIVIWNPAGATATITEYSLAVGTAASQPIIAGDIPTQLYAWNSATVAASGFVAINMAKWGGLSNTGNAIKVIHTASGFILGRGEFGTIALAPENTEMTNAADPASGIELYRTTAGTDTNSCSVDFGTHANWLPKDTIAPVVNAGSDEIENSVFSSTSAVDRTTIASATDAGGSGIATYAWTAAPAGITFGTPAALTTTITAVAGDGVSYTVTLTVTDGAGNVGADSFTLLWDTVGPVVNAGSDELRNALFSSTAGRTTIASASAVGATISTYAWTAAPAGVTFGTPAALTTTITSVAGYFTYTVTLTVTDTAGNAVVDTFTLVWDTVGPVVEAGSDEHRDALV